MPTPTPTPTSSPPSTPNAPPGPGAPAPRRNGQRGAPWPLTALLLCALLAQLLWAGARPPPAAVALALPAAPPLPLWRLADLGEDIAAAKLAMLYLQSHDDQDGVSLPLAGLDYTSVLGWLDTALALDPRGQYPLLLASQVYAAVPQPQRQRLMLDWVYRAYQGDPARRWPWLAHAALVAKHRLHDLALARRYAAAVRLGAGPDAPPWTRELEVFILEDMDELQGAQALIGGLLADGRITDAHELAFLARRLEQLAARQRENTPK